MPKTAADRLKQVHEGKHITRDSLESLKKAMQLIMGDLRDKMADMEQASELLEEHIDTLLDPDAERHHRADAWTGLANEAFDAMAAIEAFEAWTAAGATEPAAEAADLERWKTGERGRYEPAPE